MITATSTEQRTESSCAFLKRPPLRLRNVLIPAHISILVEGLVWWRGCDGVGRSTYTERFLSSLMALISIFLRPMVAYPGADARIPSSVAFEGQWSCPRAGANGGNRHRRIRNARSSLPNRCKAGRSLCLKQEPDSNRGNVSSSGGCRDDDILRYNRAWAKMRQSSDLPR